MFAMSLLLKTLFVLLAVVEPKKSFLDDLYGFGGDDVEALFNGISDSPVFSDNQGKRKGTVSKISFCFLFSGLDIPIALNLVCKLGFETYFNQLSKTSWICLFCFQGPLECNLFSFQNF